MNIPEGWPTEEMLNAAASVQLIGFVNWDYLREVVTAALAAAPTPPAESGMASVTSEDADNYCRILTLLGMEEEGDPVAEVERLLSVQASQELPHITIFSGGYETNIEDVWTFDRLASAFVESIRTETALEGK